MTSSVRLTTASTRTVVPEYRGASVRHLGSIFDTNAANPNHLRHGHKTRASSWMLFPLLVPAFAGRMACPLGGAHSVIGRRNICIDLDQDGRRSALYGSSEAVGCGLAGCSSPMLSVTAAQKEVHDKVVARRD